MINTAQLLADEAKYCSFGDTVHYVNPPKIFTGCEGSYMYDDAGTAYLDLQMWYSAVNFGYKNKRLEAKMIEQLKELPQVASQYLHPTKIELAKFIAQDAEQKWGNKGRVHFNVGGAQAIEDSLKVVRNASNGKSLMFAFEGGYHGRTLGASSITSSYRYRRRFGHFGDRAQFIPFPYPFRRPKGMTAEEYSDQIVREFARKFENEYHAVWDPKTNQCEYAAFYVEPIQGTGGYVVPPPNFFKGLKKVLDDHGVLMVVGIVAFVLLEWTNQRTIGGWPVVDKLTGAGFHGITVRTAGFNTLDIAQMRTQSWLVSDVLMFIGGGSAGTAGGIKVTTFALLAVLIWSEVRGEAKVHVMRRSVAPDVQRQAVTVALLSVGLVFAATLALSITTEYSLDQILFEVISAFGTVGLTTGITPSLPGEAQALVILLMYIGRLGPITLATSLALRTVHRHYDYPQGQVVVG